MSRIHVSIRFPQVYVERHKDVYENIVLLLKYILPNSIEGCARRKLSLQGHSDMSTTFLQLAITVAKIST